METLTLHLPEAIVQKIHVRGISSHQLTSIISLFLEAYLQEVGKADDAVWPDAAEFASRLIADNPELFAKLAKL